MASFDADVLFTAQHFLASVTAGTDFFGTWSLGFLTNKKSIDWMIPRLILPSNKITKKEMKCHNYTCFPHGHSRGNPSRQSPQSPIWHCNWQVCMPHGYNWLHFFSHCQTRSSQLRSWTLLPHKQDCLLFFEHGGHFSWQISPQTWIPHFNFNLHWNKRWS